MARMSLKEGQLFLLPVPSAHKVQAVGKHLPVEAGLAVDADNVLGVVGHDSPSPLAVADTESHTDE